jgi:hypothetical protein
MCILYYAPFFPCVVDAGMYVKLGGNVCFSYLTNGALILCGSTSDIDF